MEVLKKIKSGIKVRHAFLIAAAAAVVLFTVQLFKLLSTAPDYWLNGLFGVVFAVIAIAIISASALAQDINVKIQSKKSLLVAIAFAAVGLALIADAVVYFYGYSLLGELYKTAELAKNSSVTTFTSVKEYLTVTNNVTLSDDFIQRIYMLGGVKSLWYAIVELLAAASFLLGAYDLYTGKGWLKKHPIAALVPTIWVCLRMVLFFMYYTTIARLSESLLDILFISALMIFLFGLARLISGHESSKKVIVSTVSGGLLAALITVLASFTRYILIILGKRDTFPIHALPSVLDLVISVAIVIYLLAVILPQCKAEALSEAESTVDEEAEEAAEAVAE
ncbi:MAG: hypothetical protein LBS74_09195 [Oscillospiraceae bacterium]|jgi:hypothetical protein|nr:hypothetical protein [Oscillospiraceae bacterium]